MISRHQMDRWKKRFNITQRSVVGESRGVKPETVLSWKERLPVIVSRYAMEDIYNFDETGFFGEPCQSVDLVNTAKNAKAERNQSKE